MCDLCNYEYWLQEIEDLINSGKCDWAFETLDGIDSWVRGNKHITNKQIAAIQNIKARVVI